MRRAFGPSAAACRLTDGWRLTLTAPGRFAHPGELPDDLAWEAAQVPGTAAGALREAGKLDLDAPPALHAADIWYHARLDGSGDEVLRFDGLATLADIWLNDAFLLRSDNMFTAHEIDVRLRPANDLWICFRSLDAELAARRGRARWRPNLVVERRLRSVRSTLLGHMPGWCPPVGVVGPWRPISRFRAGAPLEARRFDLRTDLRDGTGTVTLACEGSPGEELWLEVEGQRTRLRPAAPGMVEATLHLPGVELWWPHTHGVSRLYRVRLEMAGQGLELGKVGFRTLALDRGRDDDHFALLVNGEKIFCRGAVWAAADLVAMPERPEALAPWLRLMRDAGMNMVRVSGVTVYEADAFYALCDELGLLVWQDFMFANFDYPAEESFKGAVEREADWFLRRTRAHPSLAILCGGSEVFQQAAMLGLSLEPADFALFEDVLPRLAARLRPDVPYVANTPSGGSLPFQPDRGVTHYYGVGAYRRPLEDARRAEVRFAAECLALAHVPDSAMVEAFTTKGIRPGHHPAWKSRVPRDLGATWDFEDVRDHYLGALFGVDAQRLRFEEPERYLDLSRAVSCELAGELFAEWRRPASTCSGGLVWMLQDLRPGAGWGIVDSSGAPKSAWHGLKHAFRPLQVNLTDEGLNGLAIHVINEAPDKRQVVLRLVALSEQGATVIAGDMPLALSPRQSLTLAAQRVVGSFFDFTYAYRFGPPGHQVTIATLVCPVTGALLADAFHFPGTRLLPRQDLGLAVSVEEAEGGWILNVSAERFAQYVHLEDDAFIATDDWFHLPPGQTRHVCLQQRASRATRPSGRVLAINGLRAVRYRA